MPEGDKTKGTQAWDRNDPILKKIKSYTPTENPVPVAPIQTPQSNGEPVIAKESPKNPVSQTPKNPRLFNDINVDPPYKIIGLAEGEEWSTKKEVKLDDEDNKKKEKDLNKEYKEGNVPPEYNREELLHLPLNGRYKIRVYTKEGKKTVSTRTYKKNFMSGYPKTDSQQGIYGTWKGYDAEKKSGEYWKPDCEGAFCRTITNSPSPSSKIDSNSHLFKDLQNVISENEGVDKVLLKINLAANLAPCKESLFLDDDENIKKISHKYELNNYYIGKKRNTRNISPQKHITLISGSQELCQNNKASWNKKALNRAGVACDNKLKYFVNNLGTMCSKALFNELGEKVKVNVRLKYKYYHPMTRALNSKYYNNQGDDETRKRQLYSSKVRAAQKNKETRISPHF